MKIVASDRRKEALNMVRVGRKGRIFTAVARITDKGEENIRIAMVGGQ
jgi:hypothetical protein